MNEDFYDLIDYDYNKNLKNEAKASIAEIRLAIKMKEIFELE